MLLAPQSASRIAISFNDLVEFNRDGAHWATIYAGRNRDRELVRDLQWVGTTHLFVAATDGLFRTDFGDNCFTHQISSANNILRLAFLGLLTGWAIAGTDDRSQNPSTMLVRTIDGGVSWLPVQTGLRAVDWVQFLDGRIGYAAGPDGVVRTDDAGLGWRRTLTLDWSRMRFSHAQVGFTDTMHGFVYYSSYLAMHQQSGNVWHTSDGGKSWALESCSCGYVSSPYGTEMGAKASLPGGKQSQLAVTGLISASIVSWSPAGPDEGQARYCASSNGGRDWTCRPIPGAHREEIGLGHWGRQAAWTASGPTVFESQDGGTSWHKFADLP